MQQQQKRVNREKNREINRMKRSEVNSPDNDTK